MRLKGFIVLGFAVLALGLFWLAATQESKSNKSSVLATDDLKQKVQAIGSGELPARSASIDARQLTLVADDDTQTRFALPEDEFFVSIAPYLEHTHPCAIHNLATCRGELPEESFAVRVVDASGQVVIDETMTSQANGFIDLWLPREQVFQVTIVRDGQSAESELSTFEEDPTCITSMQLGA